ncbi:ABC transporter ATP-binding protein [Bosea sp. NBC_00550]|uniref:ABC transporter ATP-binding protein n=1 Tax=Bosea sp. NBC_00550 TaxID=2969621 RepID=UPI00222F6225|nr:ABC transporter ATP-binding protein [Bosea sp. NBC_00550]UZF94947.1 ABC transporter ATP-binding protein [Bosea sp. NBC_00550]
MNVIADKARAGAELELAGISKRFGSVVALAPLELTVPGGSLISLLGPSGCGKTTTLRIIAGFERPDTGSVRVSGREITDLPPNKRKLGMVFQNYSLFPHMSVADNIGFGLKMAGQNGAAIATRVAEALDMVRLSGYGDRFVHQLSGGQQQRVALARSIVTDPIVLLLDEPLGALDKNLRENMQFELRQLQQSLGITAVLVTHDQEEALTMSDLVAVMKDGAVLQIGTPTEVYGRPTCRFVAEFLGASTIFNLDGGEQSGDVWTGRTSEGIAVRASRAPSAQPGLLSIRPEKVRLERGQGSGAENAIAGTVTGHVFRGSSHAYQISISGGPTLVAYTSPRDFDAAPIDIGDHVVASWRPDDVVLLAE